jgi:hypothetical protein
MPKQVRVKGYSQTTRTGRTHIVGSYRRRLPRQSVFQQHKGKNARGEDEIVVVEIPPQPRVRVGGRAPPMRGGAVERGGRALTNEQMGIGGGEGYDLSARGIAETSPNDAVIIESPSKEATVELLTALREKASRPSIFVRREPTSEEVYSEFYGNLPMPRAPRRQKQAVFNRPRASARRVDDDLSV